MVSILTPVSRDNSPIGMPSHPPPREAVIWGMLETLASVVTTGCKLRDMSVKEGVTAARASRGPALLAAGGLVGALAASSCCILPLALFSIGVSGAWIGSFTRLAPYQPYFVAAALISLGAGYRAVYRSSKRDCAGHGECARGLPNP